MVHFQHVTRTFSSLDALTNADAPQSFSSPSVAAPCTLIDVAVDFDRAISMLVRARDRNNTTAVDFYEAMRQHYISEQARLLNGNVQQNE